MAIDLKEVIKGKKFLLIAFAVLSVICYYMGLFSLAIFYQLLSNGLFDTTSFIFLIFFSSMVGVTIFLIKDLLKTKIAKHTYLFAFFVVAVSSTLHVVANFILKFEWSLELIVVFSIIVSTPLSCILSGYARRTFWARLKNLIMEQGITFLTLLILASIPVVEFVATSSLTLTSHGIIRELPLIFEEGNDTAGLNYTLTNVLFEAQTNLNPNSTLFFNQIIKISNQISYDVNISSFFEGFHGKTYEINELRAFFKFDNGSSLSILSITKDNLDFEAYQSIRISKSSSISMGLFYSTGELLSEPSPVLQCQMKLDKLNLSINIGIE